MAGGVKGVPIVVLHDMENARRLLCTACEKRGIPYPEPPFNESRIVVCLECGAAHRFGALDEALNMRRGTGSDEPG